jgi:ABC-type sugar transport system substrate-binding protein
MPTSLTDSAVELAHARWKTTTREQRAAHGRKMRLALDPAIRERLVTTLAPAGDLGAADIGKAGVEQAIAALKGEPVQKKIGTGFVVVTKDNMNDPDVKPFLYKSTC